MALTDATPPVVAHNDSPDETPNRDSHAQPSPADERAADQLGVVLPAELVGALIHLADNLKDHGTPAAPTNLTVIRARVTDAPTRPLSMNRNRRKAHVKNSGGVTVYVHSVEGVTPGTGFPLAAGENLPAPIEGTAQMYAITDPGNVGELSVLIELA